MKTNFIAWLLLLVTLVCISGCSSPKDERPEIVDGYYTYILQEDGTYTIKATDPNNFPEEITIPKSYNGVAISGIADHGFSKCKGLKKVTIPETFTKIETGAFYMCPDLVEVILPKSIQSFGKGSFGLCEQELTFRYDGTKAEWENIRKANNWASEVRCYAVCSDGSVYKSYKVDDIAW